MFELKITNSSFIKPGWSWTFNARSLSDNSTTEPLPEEDLSEVKVNRLSRWQHLQQFYQHFWKRWSKKYLNQLQQSVKWRIAKRNLQRNDLVILKEENTHPGRIENLHFGQDGKSRVVTMKTQNGTYIRPISKLVLILEEDEWLKTYHIVALSFEHFFF